MILQFLKSLFLVINMDTFYINKHSVGSVDSEFLNEFMLDKVVDSIDELQDDKILLLNDEQVKYFQANPERLIDDPISVFYMKPIPPETLNEEIRKKRESLYQTYTDSLYMAYIKYKEFGDTDAAEEAYNKWKQAVLDIENTNPYTV